MRYLLIILICLFPAVLHAADIRLLAAASLRELVNDAKVRFEQQYPEHRLLISTSSSGTLARQIEAGAPADLFLSANPQWMEYLVKRGKIAPEGQVYWADNRLVVVGRGPLLNDLQGLGAFSRLAIARPESAPAGRYAKAMLESVGLYDSLEENRRLVFTRDVRQGLLYAEQGVVDAAIVYASDARLLQEAKVLLVPDAARQPEIHYPIALTRTGEANPAAQMLFAQLTSEEGARLLTSYGLLPLLGSGD